MARPKRPDSWWVARRGNEHNSRFYLYWYADKKGTIKRRSLHTTDQAEAHVRAAAQIREGKVIPSQREGQSEVSAVLPVARALDLYFRDHVQPHCADTKRQWDAITHLKAFFGEKSLSSVDVPLSREYARRRVTGGIGGGEKRKNREGSPATIRRELNVLVAAANHAVWMKRPGAVAVQVDLPPEKRLGPDDEAPYYAPDELERIFEKAAEYDRENKTDVAPFMLLLYQTGARRRSIQNLTCDQVKTDARRILLQKPGKKATRKRQPIVPILKAMESTLDDLMTEERRALLLAKNRGDHLFEHTDYYRVYRRITAAAGIDDARQHPHIMRHTRATHLLQAGKSIYDVAKLLGDTVKTVERVYGHHSAEHLASRLED